MKVLHLSTVDMEGGAARSAHRLHQGLRQTGADSQMLVRAKFGIDQDVIADRSPLTKLGPRLDGLPLQFYQHRERAMFSSQWAPDAIESAVKQLDPDIILLHWVYNGFLNINTLHQFKKPLVWLQHFPATCSTVMVCR